MVPSLEAFRRATGVYWGTGSGIESGRFVGRVRVEPAVAGVQLHYEAWSEREGLQHREQALLSEGPDGLRLHTAVSEMPEVLTFEAEGDSFALRDDVGMPMRIVLLVAPPDRLHWAWWWSPPGEPLVERSKLVARRAH
ncbi:MAG TPA: hypothetical protein VKA65_04660 [Acidimicrobiales bacterium]|jgi:hypothetical protein|nr:hypothetical protein [Acidimicrobiales bacterium]